MSKPSKSPLDAMLSALPDKKHGSIKWTLEEDAALLKYAPVKGVPALAKAMGKTAGATHYRYNYLRGLTKAKK
jgi:hypothetical protein